MESPTPGRCNDPQQVTRIAREFGFELLDDAGIGEARDLAVALLGDRIASLECYKAVSRIVGSGVFGLREQSRLIALSASFPLNAAGLSALQRGALDAVELNLEFLGRPGETPAAYYGWGFLGASNNAATKVLLLSRAIHRRLFWATPTYTRAVTHAGMRACMGIGFVAAPGTDPKLLWIPANTFAPTAVL